MVPGCCSGLHYATVSERVHRWPGRRRGANGTESLRGGPDAGTQPLSLLAQRLPPSLRLCHGPMGTGLACTRAFGPGEDIAVEGKLVWSSAEASQSSERGKAFDLERLFPTQLRQRCGAEMPAALTAALALLSRSVVSDGLYGWFQGTCSGPQHWKQLPGPRLGLRRRAGQAKQLLEEAHKEGFLKVPVSVTEEELMDLDLRRIGVSLGQPSSVPFTLALVNHSCNPNAKLVCKGPQLVLVSLRNICQGEEIFVSYINEIDDVLSRRYFLLESHGVKCLCPRCHANFSGVGGSVLNGWLCASCREPMSDEALCCPRCGNPASRTARVARQQRSLRAEQAFRQCLRQLQQLRVSGSGIDPDALRAVLSALQRIMADIQFVRPPGSKQSVQTWVHLRNVLTGSRFSLPGVKEFVALMETELCKELAVQRRVLQSESIPPVPPSGSSDDAWQRRLAAALRLSVPCGGRAAKRRLGPRSDGGYVVWDDGQRPLFSALLSYGADTNVDFEWELAMTGTDVLLFDHTVEALPRQHPKLRWRPEALAAEPLPGTAGTLEEHLEQLLAFADGERIALKADVEGAEFAAILSTPEKVLSRFDQICLELHWLGRPMRGGDYETKARALEKLAEQFVLLHAHGNSYGDILNVAGCQLPDVLEVLYVHKRLLAPGSTAPSEVGLVPNPMLDANNCQFVPDISLVGAPFGADVP